MIVVLKCYYDYVNNLNEELFQYFPEIICFTCIFYLFLVYIFTLHFFQFFVLIKVGSPVHSWTRYWRGNVLTSYLVFVLFDIDIFLTMSDHEEPQETMDVEENSVSVNVVITYYLLISSYFSVRYRFVISF